MCVSELQKFPELKNTTIEMKNSLEGFKSRPRQKNH